MKMVIIIISFVSILLALCIVAAVQEPPEEYLEIHNDARASLGIPPLKWDVKLAKTAQQYLNKLIQNCVKGKLQPIKSRYYGQNVAWHMASDPFTGAKAVAGWVAEKKYYDYKSNSCIGGDCECYTQVVWRNTTHIGCARVKCDKCQKRCTLVLCLYSPPGNADDMARKNAQESYQRVQEAKAKSRARSGGARAITYPPPPPPPPKNGKYQPTIDPYYGQNVAWHMTSDHFTGAKAVEGWVAEKKYYDHKSNLCIGGDCECYIQVVWRDTTHVGCARVKCDKCQVGCTLVACLYSPPGNDDGVRPY
ncbi:pathogenesis-related protein 1A-like [Arachis stenosperma]|uniref:pathogenesis-related protein 1A-like n=1 Tax=Arachis stenosperma TaxID=217475 RepID=UPI0025AC4091|nr:pathogenesis-related protein 1A-like [Arachis stenosperma]